MPSPYERTPPTILTLILMTGIATLTLNMFVPSLVNIATELDADYALVSVSIAGYLAVTAVLQIIVGPLSDRYGRRPVILTGTAIFSIASVGCLLAENIWLFLACRFVQAAVITGGGLSRVIVRDILPPKEAAAMLGYIAMAMAVAPMLGPMAGGVLDEFFGWRANFLAFALIGGALLVLCWFDLGETNREKSETFGHQLKGYPSLLRSGVFWGYAICMAFSTGAFFAFIAGVPLVASQSFDLSTSTLGVYMGSITGGFFCGSFVAARLARRVALSTLIVAGRLIACVGLALGLVAFAAGYVHEFALFGSTIFVGIGNGLSMPGCNVGVMSVRSDLAGTASGLAGAMTMACGAVLTWFAGLAVTGDNGAGALLALMLGVSGIGLVSALWVRKLSADPVP